MSSALAYDPTILRLPAPIGLQPAWLASDAPRKVLRVGRRGTKSRFAMIAAIDGHGPRDERNIPKFKGVLQGMDVVWVAQDYPNLSTVMWREEFVPRFRHLPYVDMNQNDHAISFSGLGTLFLRPETAIDGIRGIGKKLGGVIIDEAAWLDLEHALQDVILAALLDNDGWLIIMSTTNAGPDGNQEKRVPSYFNLICEEIRAGKRGPDWVEFYGTAFDNPRISRKGIAELIAEYPADSPKLKQEVYAELLRAGVGLALSELTEAHIVPRRRVPTHWTMFGGIDWGFNHPWVFGWYACDEDGNVVKVDTLWGREMLPTAIADAIIAGCPYATGPRFIIHAGHDIFDKKGEAIGFKGPTIAEKLQARGLKVIKAARERVNGLDNLRRYIHPIPGGDPIARFTLMDTPGNRWSLRVMQAMQLDPDNIEDALKVDASAGTAPDGFPVGGDDPYDEVRYSLMSRPIDATSVNEDDGEREGVSVGYDYEAAKPRTRESAEDMMAKLIKRAQPHVTSGRYKVPRR